VQRPTAASRRSRLGPPSGVGDIAARRVGISFLDSSGIRCLLACARVARARRTRLIIVDPAALVTQVLEVSGLLETFGLPLPEKPNAWPGSTAPMGAEPGHIAGEHRPVPAEELLTQTAAIRQAAQQTRERAEEMRRDNSRRRKRLGMP
jgi:hypothetical protein